MNAKLHVAVTLVTLLPIITVAASGTQTSSSSRASAAQAYVRDFSRHVHEERQAVHASEQAASTYASEVGRSCPQALSGAPEDVELRAFRVEISGSVFAATIAPFAREERVYARDLEGLDWQQHTIAHLLSTEASGERDAAAFVAPPLCEEARRWRQTQFAAVPRATTRFDRSFAARLSTPPTLRHLNHLIAHYAARAADKRLQHATALNSQVDEAVTRLWLATTSTVMRALGVA
ncbi:MAG: hypothetical protein ACYCXW_23020 [Solirubrobacteraceae bacterium]